MIQDAGQSQSVLSLQVPELSRCKAMGRHCAKLLPGFRKQPKPPFRPTCPSQHRLETQAANCAAGCVPGRQPSGLGKDGGLGGGDGDGLGSGGSQEVGHSQLSESAQLPALSRCAAIGRHCA